MHTLKKFVFGEHESNSKGINLGLLLLRSFAGLSMAFSHGLGKIPPSEGLINGTANMGFPLPVFFAWAAGLSEFAGGILIALGLTTRPSALFLGITMFVAGFIRHADDPFGRKELALLYLVISIVLVVTGPGKYSIDRYINRN